MQLVAKTKFESNIEPIHLRMPLGWAEPQCQSRYLIKVAFISLIQLKRETRQPSAEVYVIRQARLTLSLFYIGLTITQCFILDKLLLPVFYTDANACLQASAKYVSTVSCLSSHFRYPAPSEWVTKSAIASPLNLPKLKCVGMRAI